MPSAWVPANTALTWGEPRFHHVGLSASIDVAERRALPRTLGALGASALDMLWDQNAQTQISANAVNGDARLAIIQQVRGFSRLESKGCCSRALRTATWVHTVYEFARSPACAGGAEVARDGTKTAGCCGGGPTCAGCS